MKFFINSLINQNIKNFYNNGFVINFFLGLLIILGFYHPFDQPIQWDRAYLFHMAQVVARGEPLYITTTFGYTPLGTLLVGFFMWMGKLFSISTLVSAKIVGITLYGLICAHFFRLVSTLFTKKNGIILACVFFLGLGYLPMLSGVNAEPKLWVLFFTLLGMKAVFYQKWLLIGLYFSLSAMCWHASVISLLPCLIFLPYKRKEFKKSTLNFIAGISLGTLPVIAYLFMTNSWENFWYQAVMRKILIEGDTVGESPLTWLYRGIYPFFVPDILHFILGLFGLAIVSYLFLFRNIKLNKYFKGNNSIKFLLVYSLVWGAFNTMEFQTPVDLFTLIPVVIIFAAFFIQYAWPVSKKSIVIALIILVYNFYDAIIYKVPYTLNEQVQLAEKIQKKYGKAFVIGFEEHYTVLDRPMPTRFMRYSPYEDHLIKKEEGGCQAIAKKLKSEHFHIIIEMNWGKRIRSKYSQFLIERMQQLLNKKEDQKTRSDCADQIIGTLTDQSSIDHFTMKIQSIPFGDYFYTEEYYSIYEIQ